MSFGDYCCYSFRKTYRDRVSRSQDRTVDNNNCFICSFEIQKVSILQFLPMRMVSVQYIMMLSFVPSIKVGSITVTCLSEVSGRFL